MDASRVDSPFQSGKAVVAQPTVEPAVDGAGKTEMSSAAVADASATGKIEPDANKETTEPKEESAKEKQLKEEESKDGYKATDWLPPACEPHPETEEIIRQVEYYFSDENLVQDAHLLSKTGSFGDKWVSLSEILGWKKMRKFRPPLAVKASLHQSTKLLVWRNKNIRRIAPLQVPLTVEPKEDPKREQNKMLVEKPWLTKGMLKPTGFEKNFAEAPLKPEDAEAESKLFDPEELFIIRIENAVARYQSRRKMHQKTLQVFTRFLVYGGFKTGSSMFGGGLGPKELEEFDKDEIAQMKCQFSVSELVLDDMGSDNPIWVVDFETHAKAFLSCEFMAGADNWKDVQEVNEATNILRNFYNYLLHHDVCPEYNEQIYNAKDVCDLADEEFPKLAKFDDGLNSRGFNAACSTLHGGHWKQNRPWDLNAEWVNEFDANFMTDTDAYNVMVAGVQAHCSREESDKISEALTNKTPLKATPPQEMGLEVVSVELPSGEVKGTDEYTAMVKPIGKLHCIRWKTPGAAPRDLPKDVRKERRGKTGEKLTFLLEEDALRACVPGMKVAATVRQLETGLKWIDSFSFTYPSFYTFTLNEQMQGYKEPGPPKAWMVRANSKDRVGGGEVVRREDEEADSTPD